MNTCLRTGASLYANKRALMWQRNQETPAGEMQKMYVCNLYEHKHTLQ